MLKRRRGFRLRTLIILVAGCAVLCGLGVLVYRELSPVARSARQLRPGNSVFTRSSAVGALANSVPSWEREEAYRVLLAALHDPDSPVRAAAANSLGIYREHAPEVVTALLGLAKDKAPRVRETALFALERLVARGSPEAQSFTQAAVAALEDPSPDVRLEAGRALYVLGTGRLAVPALARLAQEERGSHRGGALGFLMAMKTMPKELEPILRAMLKSDDVWGRFQARRALIELGVSDRRKPKTLIESMLKSHEDRERLEGAGDLDSAPSARGSHSSPGGDRVARAQRNPRASRRTAQGGGAGRSRSSLITTIASDVVAADVLGAGPHSASSRPLDPGPRRLHP